MSWADPVLRAARWLESIFYDLRFGLRMLRKDLVVSGAAILSMSLAIGACVSAFTLIDALILRPLPVHDPSQLVHLVYPRWDGSGREDESVSYSLLNSFREVSSSQMDLFGVGGEGFLRPATFDDSGGQEERVRAQGISGNAFGVLGVQPAAGRVLTAEDDQRPVAVLSYDFWIRRFAESNAVIGKWVALNGTQYQIVAVARKGFSGLAPGMLTDFWHTDVVDARALANPEAGWAGMWGRLKPGVANEQAREVLQVAFTNWRRSMVKFFPPGTPARRIDEFLSAPLKLQPAGHGLSYLRSGFARALWILAVVVGLVWLIACSNVANLLIARAAAREREMAMRLSIGAGRGRLIQQMLIESSLIAGAACALGLLFASSATPAVVDLLAPSENPAYLDVSADGRVLAFVATVGLFATLLFGLPPALRASSVSLNAALKAGAGDRSMKIGLLRPLLGAQVSFSFLVLFAAGLLLLSFQQLMSVDLGFAKKGVVLFSIRTDERQPDRVRVAAQQLLDSVREVRGVQAASLSGWALGAGMTSPVWNPPVRMAGRAPEPQGPNYLSVSPEFFSTMRIPLLDGRDFDVRDAEPEKPTAVIVNRTFARLYFAGENALGRRFERIGDAGPIPQEIVGVVADAKYNNVRETAPPTVYVPIRDGRGATLEVRTAWDPLPLIPGLRSEIERRRTLFRITGATLQSKVIDDTLLQERLLAMLSAFFAVVALVLAAVGLYGVISYSVVRRTREIGIRVALGAERSVVIRLVLAEVARIAGMGLAAGLVIGVGLGRFIGSLLYQVKPYDFASVVLPSLCLLAAAAVASLLPALRATRVDPMTALRHE